MADCLALHDVSAGYGETVVLERVSLGVAEGGTLAVLGRNGVGKTTLLATVLGHTTLHAGAIAFRGQPIERLRPFQRARLGIGYVPQEREIFPSLNVDENLGVAARNGARWTRERIYELFPSLAERRRNMGNQLSGGEQQMLAIGRALMGNPRCCCWMNRWRDWRRSSSMRCSPRCTACVRTTGLPSCWSSSTRGWRWSSLGAQSFWIAAGWSTTMRASHCSMIRDSWLR